MVNGFNKDIDYTNRDMVLKAVQENGLALEYASDELKDDVEIVITAVNNNGLALMYASDELKKDNDIIRAAVSENVKVSDSDKEETDFDKEFEAKEFEAAVRMLLEKNEQENNG